MPITSDSTVSVNQDLYCHGFISAVENSDYKQTVLYYLVPYIRTMYGYATVYDISASNIW